VAAVVLFLTAAVGTVMASWLSLGLYEGIGLTGPLVFFGALGLALLFARSTRVIGFGVLLGAVVFEGVITALFAGIGS
jgi:hypothetical protein